MIRGKSMELYIGGFGQGKKEYVKGIYKDRKLKEYEKDQIEELFLKEEKDPFLIDQFHLWIRKKLEEGQEVEKLTEELIKKYPDCIVISDEIGNGLVPIDAFEREYRDRTGRILIDLAKRSERVERIICGLGQRLK